jgi:ABC-2 type transport system ATP-binding protein
LLVTVDNISKTFAKRTVLHNITFSLNKGITAFLGVNGAGKSTTLNILAGVLAQDTGAIVVGSMDMSKQPIEVKRNIGYLPESNPLYEDMYVYEYLEYAAGFYLPKKQIKGRVDEMIESLDLKGEYKKKIHTLSHGNKQRVGLAQALVHDPEVLILDEPSNGLDPIQQVKLNNLLMKLGESKTLLFSSHRLDDVADIASRYLVIKDGKLVLDEQATTISSIKEFFYTITNENCSR